MSKNDQRYISVDAALPPALPPISAADALKYYKKLRKGTSGHSKGWGRLVHDASHYVFRQRHPSARPHDGGHAMLERAMAEYIVSKEWLS